MPVIYSYPSKTSPTSGDLLLISDVSASNQTKKSTIGNIGTTIQTDLGLVDGSGTLNKISKWSDANTLTDSIITEDPAAPSISVSGSLSVTGASNYLFVPSILDSSGSQGTANQVLSAGPSGNSIKWTTSTSGGSPGGTNQMVQYNDNNSFGASGNFTYAQSARVLRIGDQDTSGGVVSIAGGPTGGAGQLRLGDNGTSGNEITLKAPDDVSPPYNIVLPGGSPGGANKILESDASGNLSWITTPSGNNSGFETIPLASSSEFITATGTYVFQSIAASSISSNFKFKFFHLLGLSSGRTVVIGIFKGSLSDVNSATLHSTGTISGVLDSKTFTEVSMTKDSAATDLAVGDPIVVCFSVNENISIPGTASAISDEFIARFSSSVAGEYTTLSALLTGFTFVNSLSRISALLKNSI